MSILQIKKAVIFLVLVAVMTVFLAPGLASAFTFGGRIFFALPCTNGGLLLGIGPPQPGVFVFQAGFSQVHSNYQLRPGPWALGSYVPGGLCILGLFPVPALGTIKQIGTSF